MKLKLKISKRWIVDVMISVKKRRGTYVDMGRV